MIRPGPGTRIWLACGFTDMRRGFDGLAALVQSQLTRSPSTTAPSAAITTAAMTMGVRFIARSYQPGGTGRPVGDVRQRGSRPN